jgi:hypothetical protein
MKGFSLSAIADNLEADKNKPTDPPAGVITPGQENLDIVPPITDDNEFQLPPEISIESMDGELVVVEELDTEEFVSEEGNIHVSQEHFSGEQLAPTKKPTKGCIPSPEDMQTPPMPAIFGGPGGKVMAYLYGRCDTTVAPLLHILATATEKQTICVEVNAPYLSPQDIMSVASAIETSKAKTEVNLVCGHDIMPLLIFCSADEGELLDGAQIFSPLTKWAQGSAEDMEYCVAQFKEYSDMVLDYLIEKKILKDTEATLIRDNAEVFAVTTREIKSRMSE